MSDEQLTDYDRAQMAEQRKNARLFIEEEQKIQAEEREKQRMAFIPRMGRMEFEQTKRELFAANNKRVAAEAAKAAQGE